MEEIKKRTKSMMKKFKFAGIRSFGKKGIFFTIDAVLALAIALFLVFAIFTGMSKNVDYSNLDAGVFAQDSLATLEKSGAFLRNDSSLVELYANATPSQLCVNISVFRPSESSFIKPGCSMSNINQVSVANRVFISGTNVNYARAMAWYK